MKIAILPLLSSLAIAAFAQAQPPASINSPNDGQFVREYWAELGLEHANPTVNRRFRVNAPEVVLHPAFGSRSEVKSSGLLNVLMPEDPRQLAGAEVYLELWGGHPGTANRRVTINGRTTYQIADHGGLEHCTYQYPRFTLARTDLVNGYNALQFACDQGQTFWGHMIIDNACLRAVFAPEHEDMTKYELAGFAPTVQVTVGNGERLRVSLAVPPEKTAKIASVEFQGFYEGYDENGNGQRRDWHGFTKARQPVAVLGKSAEPPFAIDWDTSMLPDQEEVAVRAIVRLKDAPGLCYHTQPLAGIKLPPRAGPAGGPGGGQRITLHAAKDMPAPFWSRASRRKTCTISLDAAPEKIEQAELHVVVWDGGAGAVQDYFSLNGRPIKVAGSGKHDLLYTVTPVDPRHLICGDNEIVLLSDTEHHGIEICLPGPALVIRTTASGDRAATSPPAAFEQHALTHAGDPARGRELFANETLTKCAICHKVNDQGGEAGPDLTHIGGKFDRPHLIESLLEPSRQIVEGYRTTVLQTRNGQMLSGIVKQQSDEQVTLVDATGKQRDVLTADIQQRQTGPLSLMPQNIAELLSPEQFTDVIAYLETLRSGGKPTPGSTAAGPMTLPDEFTVRTVATGLTGGTALETTSDGRVFVCEQTGTLRVVKSGQLLAEPALALPVDCTWERGLIGVTVDPAFPRVPHIFVCYVAKAPYPHHVVSRFTMDGDRVVSGSEQVLLTGDDQRTLGGKVPAGHQGGGLHFDADGKLYIAIGEQTAETPSQRLDTFQGKILRINADGSIPTDNPLLEKTAGKYQAIWALGLRNPFTFAVQPATCELYINDVGGKFEEINRGVAGANYGWPAVEHGPTSNPRFRGSFYSYAQASIAGGDFCPADSSWPAAWRGKYFFGDFVHGWIKALDLDAAEHVRTFATGMSRPVDFRFAPNGKLYVLLRNAWVIDAKFQPGTSALLEIAYTP